MDSEAEQREIPGDHSFLRWFLTWRYDILTPLITINGFSELMLKDLNGTLEKPLSDDEKRKFMGIILNRSKSMRRALDFFGLYVRVREGVFSESMLWEKVSIKTIIEDVGKDLQTEELISRVVVGGNNEIPLIRTSPYDLSIVLAFMLTFTFVSVSKDREITVELKKHNDFVNVEINTNAQDHYADSSIYENFILNSDGLSLVKMVIELLDGKFETFLRDKVLIYNLLLPIWLLPAKADEVIRLGEDDQSVELFQGQMFEIVNPGNSHSIQLMRVVDFDHNIIRLNGSRGNLDGGLDSVKFAGIRVGMSEIKLEYSSPNDSSEPTLRGVRVIVKPQMSAIE